MNLTGQERFVLKGPLRNNGVGQLHAGEDLLDGARIAMRKMPLEAMGALAVEAVEALPRHEALPKVIASGRDELLAWVALEFPQGALLSVEALPLEPGLWLKVAEKLAAALAAAHAAGVVHGELSTDSVLLTDGRVLLFDLPLVLANRLTDRRGEARALAMLAQTVTYLSVERAKGAEPAEPSDVYALAVLLCLAGGAEPVSGANAMEKVYRIVSEGWKPELPPRVPEAHELLKKMLATEAKDRPTMEQVVEGLKALRPAPAPSPQPLPPHDPFEALVAKGVSVSAPDPHAVPTRQMDSVELQAQQKQMEPHATAPRPAPTHVLNKARRTPEPQPIPVPALTAPASPPPSLKAWVPAQEDPTSADFKWARSPPPVPTGFTSPELAAVDPKPAGTMPSMEAIADAMLDSANAPKTSENPLPFPSVPPPVATTPPSRPLEQLPRTEPLEAAKELTQPLPVAHEPLRLSPPVMIAEVPAPPPEAAKTATDLPAASPKSLTDTDRQEVLPLPHATAPFGSYAAGAQLADAPIQVQLPQLPPPLPTAPATRRAVPSAGPVKSAAREESPLPPGILSWISANNPRLIGSVAIALLMVLLGLSLFSELLSRRSAIAELSQTPRPADLAKQKADRLKQPPQTKSSRAAAMRDAMKQEKTDDEY